jgi:hypothetical protein
LKAEVLASKGVLVSNPDFKRMNKARWQFEFLSMLRRRKQQMADLAFILAGDSFQELDIEKQLSLVPFGYVANPEIMEKLRKIKEEDLIREETGGFMNDEEYEAMLKEMESKGHVLDDLEELSVVDEKTGDKK